MDELMRQSAQNQKSRSPQINGNVGFVTPRCNAEAEETSNKASCSAECPNRSLIEFGYNFEDVEGWSMMKQWPKDKLANILQYMVESHLKTTLVIKIRNSYFNCHLSVLQVYSQFFMELVESPMMVTLPEDLVTPKAFMIIYKWMLTSEPCLDRTRIVELFIAASYLRIKHLLAHCWMYFDDKQFFNEVTACILYVETRYHPSLDIVRNVMLTRIHQFVLIFAATKDFLDLPHNHLIYLLSSSRIALNTEVEVLYMVVRWMCHDWSTRRAYAVQLVDCIRFNCMPLWFMLFVRRDETHAQLLEFLSLDEVNEKVTDAITNITSAMYDDQIFGTSLAHKDTPHQRNWIHDKSCDYHHLIGCPNTREIRYENFEAYMCTLQQKPVDYWTRFESIELNVVGPCHCMREIF
ncbi:kelch-like protein 40b [Drosophila obscura]|uniref:kelch-like protein 40b n=1 Tax=Drosophila obscura TaxID=7282 RepID=UPI001BB200BE|nr:kelch-like protein 40b [Drosophila obscura]